GRRHHHRPQFPLVRILLHRHRHLSGAVAGLPGRVLRDRPAAVPPLEPPHVIREFPFGEALFLVAAVRWTVLLAALAFLGGSIVGLLFAVLRVSKGKLPRAAAVVYIKLFQGTPLL